MTFEGHMTTSSSHKTKPCDSSQPARKYTQEAMSIYQDSVVNHLSNILNSDNYYTVISSARVLCETVKGFVARMTIAGAEVDRQKGLGHTQISGTSGQRKPSVAGQCEVLSSKLEALLAALNDESSSTPTSATTSATEGRRDRATSESTALVSPPSDESTAQRRPLSATASNANRRSCYSETRTSVEGMSSSGDDELQEKSRDLKSRMACKETEVYVLEIVED